MISRRLAVLFSSLALRAFPAAQRADYGAEMIDTFTRELAARAEQHGRWAAARFAIAAWADAIRAGLGERRYRRKVQRQLPTGSARVGISWLDVKLGFRMLARYPGLSVAGGLALAIAIGIGSGWYDLSREVLRPTLPLPGGDRFVEIEMRNTSGGEDERRLLHDFLDWRRDVQSMEQLGAYRTLERNLVLGDTRSQPITVAEITPSAFALVGVPPQLGRPLLESDGRPGAPAVVVIGYTAWQRRFDGRSDVIGQRVQLGRDTMTVVGVMPEGFAFPVNHRMWLPLHLQPSGYAPLEGPPIRVFGRLKAGYTQAQANAEVVALAERAAAASPGTHQHLRPRVLAYGGESPGDKGWLEFALTHLPILLVLIVACANVGTLIYARTATREAEIAMRSALGAGRARIVAQLFAEALVLSAVAAVVGLGAANSALKWGMAAYAAGQQGTLPFWIHPGLKWPTVLYAAGLTIVGSAILGVLPALKATGSGVQAHLRNLGAGGSTLRFGRVWTAAMIGQVALTVICIPPATGIAQEALRDRVVRQRFPAGEYLAVRIGLDREAAPTAAGEEPQAAYAARFQQVYRELERRMEQEPGVTAVTFADRLPGMGVAVRRAEVEVAPGTAPVDIPNLWTAAVGPQFFPSFTIPVVAGRDFHEADREDGARTVLVNEAFARQYTGGASPVGRRVRWAVSNGATPEPWFEVVGMVRDIGMTPTDRGEAPYLFQPASVATVSPLVMAVRTSADPAALAPRVRAIAGSIDAGLRVEEVRTLEDLVWRVDVPQIVLAGAIVAIVGLALFLSAAGIFSLMSVSVARRTREIGLRSALGASQGRLLAGIFSRAIILVGSGIGAGNLVLVLFVGVYTATVERLDLGPVIVAVITTSAVMMAVGLLACVEPARRALRIDPTDALKDA